MYNIDYVIIEVFVYNFRDKFVNMEVKKILLNLIM